MVVLYNNYIANNSIFYSWVFKNTLGGIMPTIHIYLTDVEYMTLAKKGKPSAIGAEWIKERCDQERKGENK